MLESDRMSMDYEYSRNHQQQQFTTSNLCHSKNGLNDEIKFTTKTCFGKLTPENNLEDVFPYPPIYRGNIGDDCEQLLTDILSSSEWILTKDAEIEDTTQFPAQTSSNMRDHLRPEFEIVLIDPDVEYIDSESESDSSMDLYSHSFSATIQNEGNSEDSDDTDDDDEIEDEEEDEKVVVVNDANQIIFENTANVNKSVDKLLNNVGTKIENDELSFAAVEPNKVEASPIAAAPSVGCEIKSKMHDRSSTTENPSIDKTIVCSNSSSSSNVANENSVVAADINSKPATTPDVTRDGEATKTQPERGKRRLNIEEYYKRRRLNGGTTATGTNTPTESVAITIPVYSTLPADTQALAMASAIKKETDDEQSTAKDEPQTEIEPEMCRNAANEYEQIITVSIGCNTNVTIPPNSNLDQITNSLVKANDSIKLSSNSLIASIQDVIYKKSTYQQKPQKIKKGDEENCANNNIANKSVGASVAGTVATETGTESNADEIEEHGENKTIMYLRKDRIRPRCTAIGIQTIPTLQFGVLPVYHLRHRNNDDYYYDNDDYYDDHHDDDEDDDDGYYEGDGRGVSRSRRNWHKSGYHSENTGTGGYMDRSSSVNSGKQPFQPHRRNIKSSNSDRNMSSTKLSSTYFNNNGSDYKRCENRLSRRGSRGHSFDEDDSCNGGYDGWSRNGYESKYGGAQSQKNKKTYGMYRQEQQQQEERCIVYVGRIERHTTKDDLRKKFIRYGPILNITQHHKATGMKFGFITYERAKDAYTVIDSSSGDSSINMYDISFGGRRQFCGASYMDLDGNGDEQTSFAMIPSGKLAPPQPEHSFEEMLKAAKQRIGPNASAKKTAAIEL